VLLTREADRTHFALNPKYLNQIKHCEVIYIRGYFFFTVSKQASNLTLMAAHICTQALKIMNMNLNSMFVLVKYVSHINKNLTKNHQISVYRFEDY